MQHRVEAVGEATSLADRKRRAGQRLIVGLSGPGLTTDERALLREVRPGGFILFARNIEEPAQVRELNRELAGLLPAATPPWLTVDQEGGRVMRIRQGVAAWPPARWLGNVNEASRTVRAAFLLCQELAAMGFNLDWAPVADVHSNPANPVIGDRAFHSDPQVVARHVLAWLDGCAQAGLAACVKHFPGHGDTAQDSHLTLPVVEKEWPELERTELVPFRAAIQAGVGFVMTAHVVFPELDAERPATLSRKVVRGLLRERLGYTGVVVSDDLEMKAVRGRYPLDQQLDEATEATVDLFLACKELPLQAEAFEILVRLQERDAAGDRLAEDTERRVAAARERFLKHRPAQPGLGVLASREATDLVAWVRAQGEG